MQQLVTSQGPIIVKLAESAKEIKQLGIDDGLGFFWHHRPDLQHQALVKIAGMKNSHISIAINANRAIVGYVTVSTPDKDTRWGRDQIRGLEELGGIEVGRRWRSFGIGRALMAELFGDGVYDKSIVIATGYRWCWDYESTGLTVREYRDVLHRMMQRFGFEFFDTDEPNIAWYPENALVARIGKHAPANLVKRFKALLFENVGSEYALSEFFGR